MMAPMNLNTLIENLPLKVVAGDTHTSISRLDFDSRKVQEGSLFVAVRGTQTDGHAYLDKAIENGAVAIIAETLPATLAGNAWLTAASRSPSEASTTARFSRSARICFSIAVSTSCGGLILRIS